MEGDRRREVGMEKGGRDGVGDRRWEGVREGGREGWRDGGGIEEGGRDGEERE